MGKTLPRSGAKKSTHSSLLRMKPLGLKPNIKKPSIKKSPVPVALNAKGAKGIAEARQTQDEVPVIAGLPSETELEASVGDLMPADKARFTKIRKLLAARLGSSAAARVWLLTPGRGFDGTPLDAIRDGNAALVLDALTNQSGPNPTYA